MRHSAPTGWALMRGGRAVGGMGVLDGLWHTCCGVLARVYPAIIDVPMIWRILARHYYSTQEESCEPRRFLSRVCNSSVVPRESYMLVSAWSSAWLRLGNLDSRCPHGE